MNAATAIKPTAHQLARLIYMMLTRGQAYVERGIEAFQAMTRDKQLSSLRRKATQLGVSIVLNDVQPRQDGGPFDWAPVQINRTTPGSALSESIHDSSRSRRSSTSDCRPVVDSRIQSSHAAFLAPPPAAQ